MNGNVGASQAHLVEGYSTPFRDRDDEPSDRQPITFVLGYDIKHSDKNAYDYLTSYQRLDVRTATSGTRLSRSTRPTA